MTTDTLGGVWNYAMELIAALEDYGVDVLLFTMGAPLNGSQQFQAAQRSNLEVVETALKLEWMEDAWDDVQTAGEQLLELAELFQPDIVHLNGYAHAALDWDQPTVVVGHSCVLSWWKAVRNQEAPEEWNRYREEVSSGLQSATVVVTPTQWMLEQLQLNYTFDAPRQLVIPNGCNPNTFYQAIRKENFVLTVGRLWDEAKNIGAMERIAPNLAWHGFFVGPQTLMGEEKTQETRLGYLSTEKISHQYAKASIYALPAYYEPFGLSVVEAALSGCALVLGDIPSLRENWEEAALFVPPGDDEAIQEAINHLIQDKEARITLALRARRRAHAKFTSQQMAARYMELYRS